MSHDKRFQTSLSQMSKKYGVLFVLVTIGLACLVSLLSFSIHYLSRNDYQYVKAFISSNFEKSGYSLQYKSIGIKPSLSPAITLTQVVFSNDKVSSTNLLEAEALDINFELLPLIMGKRLVVDDFNINDARIFIVRDENGNNNWFEKSQEATSGRAMKLSLERSRLNNVEVHYTGPTFIAKKFFFREASLAYSADSVLRIESATGVYEKKRFDFHGHIDQMEGFLKGEGASLSFDLKLGTELKLSMQGDIGPTSLPTEKGLNVHVSGDNLASWLTTFVPDISDTDHFFIRAAVFRKGDAFSLDIAEADFGRGSDRLELAGQIHQLGVETADLNLDVKMTGKSFHLLDEWKYLDESFQQYIPPTDSYALEFLLSGSLKNPKLDIGSAQLIRNKHDLNMSGRIHRRAIDIFDLNLDLAMKGDAIHQLELWQVLDEEMKKYIPTTDAYELELSLSGALKQASMRIKSGKLQRHDHEVFMSGLVKELSYLQDFQFQASGNDLSGLQSAFFPELAALSYPIPLTEAYFISAGLSGKQNEWQVSAIKARLSTQNNQLTIESQADSSSDLNTLRLNVESNGSDLHELASWFGHKTLPEGVEHLLRFKLQGSVDAPSIYELDAKLLHAGSEVSLHGAVPDINGFEDMALEFGINGSERDLASLLDFHDFPDLAIEASGNYLGSLKTFHLKDFIYQGGRGRSSGELYLDLNDKPVLKAKLGDTELLFAENKVETADEPLKQASDFDLSWMDSLNLDIEYASLKIIRAAAVIEVLGSKLSMQSGKLNWDPLQLKYREATVTAGLMIDAAADHVRLLIQTRQIDFGALLAELGLFERFVGPADIDLQLSSFGKNQKELVSNLKGKARLLIRQSRVKDFGSSNMSYVRTLTPWRKTVADLEINCLLSTAKIDQGVMKLEHVFMENKNMYLTGGGKVNLNDYTVDMAFAPRAKDKNFLDANVSLFVTGPMADPKTRVGKLSAMTDVGLKYGQWALLGPLSLALPKLKFSQVPNCEQALQALLPFDA